MNEKDERIRALIQERKTTAKHEKDRIREISKEIKKCIRENKRRKRQERIQKILEKVKGTKNTPSIKSVKKRILITKVKNKEGEAVKTRQGIANVFAKFFEDVHKGEEDDNDEDMSSCTDQENADSSQIETIPEFTTEEIQAAIERLKKGKAKDSNGIRAEQLKNCSDDTKEKSGQSATNLCSRRTSQKAGERSVSKSSTKRVTGRILAITFQFVAYLFYFSCLPQY